jgi:hypothetical protein
MDDDRFRVQVLEKYESGIRVLLIIVSGAILGLIFWLGYVIPSKGGPGADDPLVRNGRVVELRLP